MTSELEIGGRVRKLCFSLMGFNKFLNQAIRKNPLVNGEQEDTFKDNENIIWAGLMCQCLVDKVEPDFTKEDIENWLPLVKISAFNKVMLEFDEYRKSEETGEAVALVSQSVGTN